MKETGESSEVAERFGQFVGSIIRGMDAIFRREMEAYEVTWPQFHLLKVVKRSERITVTELSNTLLVAAPTASRMIEGLCSKGLIEKAKDSDDHRVILVSLTPKSEALLEKLLALQRQVMSEVLAGEDPVKVDESLEFLSRLAVRFRALAESNARKGITEDG